MHLLAVDTATETCGIALAHNGDILAELSLYHGQTHTKVLVAAINCVMKLSGLQMADMDAFAVTQGPGSFTGLRIGISTVKGLTAAIGKPLIGVSSLAVLAHQAPVSAKLICPMIDARRSEIYWTLYWRQGQDLKAQIDETVSTPEAAAKQIDNPCFFIGNGATLYRETIRSQLHHPAQWDATINHAPRPAVVARLGWQRWLRGERDDPATFAPVYLRKCDAELNRKQG